MTTKAQRKKPPDPVRRAQAVLAKASKNLPGVVHLMAHIKAFLEVSCAHACTHVASAKGDFPPPSHSSPPPSSDSRCAQCRVKGQHVFGGGEGRVGIRCAFLWE